ncbi:carboxypeptidase-like regulatory domain-containing protein [Bacteroides zhangwenhongii]|uniref:carboxypeptidase-like regulatory domain-containing protein n=1 Tax=Bacteroides zhangwenhongii TaxID=2650157 RepID=UPI0032C125EE
MKQTLVLLLALLFPSFLFAQRTGTGIKGCVIGADSKCPVPGVIVTLNGENRQTRTDVKGAFFFDEVSPGKDVLIFNSVGITPKNILAEVTEGMVTDLGNIEVVELTITDNLSLIGVLDEASVDDDVESGSQEISSKVILSNDVYLNKASYQLSPMRFRVRGYENIYEQRYINGVNFNDQLRGVFNYSSIGALNDMTRNGDVVNYNRPSAFTYGSIGGTENINMRASSISPGTKATLSYANRNYYLRAMVTHSTGLLDNGWAFAASVGGRYSHEGAVDGTFYRNFSYALSAEKQWKDGEHSFSIVTFGSPVQRGQQSATYQQACELVDNYQYNPNWGYQNGKKRNAKVVMAFDPTLVLSHVWKIDDESSLVTGLGVHYGRYGNTALNWYNASDPRPDYYRKLPFAKEIMVSTEAAEDVELLWRRNNTSVTQVNWDEMYLANYAQPDGRAQYMVEERRSDLFETTLNSTFNTKLGEHNWLTAGAELRHTLSRQFKTVDDLLGASYVMDYDKYAERDIYDNLDSKQNDLNRPDRKVYEGGIFGYNFNLNIFKANAWIMNQHKYAKVDFYYGAKVSYTSFYRDGKMKNGRYPENSYGKGRTHSFVDMAMKAGLTYKFNGRHFLTANVSYGTEAPLANNAYLSPRISDFTSEDVENGQELKSGRVFSADVNYIFSLPSFTGRVSLYQTNFYDQMERSSYFNGTNFFNHVLYGVDRIHRGIELGATYKLDDHWSFDLAGTISEYYYNNNPMAVENYEATQGDKTSRVYMKNLYVSGTPQFAGTFGVRYFIDYWFLGANLNAFGRNYIDVAPARRMEGVYDSVDPTIPEQWNTYQTMTTQERIGSACTLDLSVGKIFYLRNRQSINFNLSVNNVLNKRDIRTGGYEQARVFGSDGTLVNPLLFPNKYYYMQGINCFANISYRF